MTSVLTRAYVVLSIVLLILSVLMALRFYKARHFGDTLLVFKSSAGGKSNYLIPLLPVLVLVVIDVAENGLTIKLLHNAIFVSPIVLYFCLDYFIGNMEIREEGLLTKYRGVYWKDVKWYYQEQEQHKGQVTSTILHIRTTGSPRLHNVKIHLDMYENSKEIKEHIARLVKPRKKA